VNKKPFLLAAVLGISGLLASTAAALPAAAFSAAALPAAAAARPPAPRHVIGGPQLASHGIVVNYPRRGHGWPFLPDVPASAYVIADAGTGEVLAAKDPHGRYLPASTLKVLTADALMPVLRPDQEIKASAWAASIEPSKVGLLAGHWYKASDLFTALLMISANDAAVALAQATGSYHQGMTIINAAARRLQASDTVAVRPNGLDAPGQHVSAYDEALFARAALALPQFMRIESLHTARFPLTPRHWITLYCQNTMLGSYRGDLGGKIGWTTPAEATFIGWARRHGHTLVVTILHATPLTEMTTAAQLLDWGFAMDGKVRPVGTLVSPLPAVTSRPRPRPVTHRMHRLVTDRAAAGLPVAPIVAGAVTFVAAALLGGGTIALVRRWRAAAGSQRAR
jgi:serine-type D-Ala-D-Ala carboxypeptidase (penicillin-binding protein 5/6)